MHCNIQESDHYAFCMRCSKWCCNCNVECPVAKKERYFGPLMKWTKWSGKCSQSIKCVSCITVDNFEDETTITRSLSPIDKKLFFHWEEESNEIF